jgi:hypothetical protein
MNTCNEDLYNKINDLKNVYSNKRCELTALEKDIKDIYHEMLDLKRAYCVEWFAKNGTNYFKLVKYGETFYEHYITDIRQYPGMYNLFGCKVNKINDSVTRIEPEIKTEYDINGFYALITNEHSDKIYKVEVDDIMDIVDNFAHRIVRKMR